MTIRTRNTSTAPRNATASTGTETGDYEIGLENDKLRGGRDDVVSEWLFGV